MARVGDEEHLLFVAQTLGISAASLIGPWRPLKYICNGEQNDKHVTSHVLDLLRVLQCSSPAAAIMRDACTMQAQAVGSGVTSVAVLVGALSEAAASLLRAGIPRHEVVLGFDEATELCEAVFDGAAQCCARGTAWALLSGLGRCCTTSSETPHAGTMTLDDTTTHRSSVEIAEEFTAADADDVSWFFADSSGHPVHQQVQLHQQQATTKQSVSTGAYCVDHACQAALRLAYGLQHQHDVTSDRGSPELSVAMQIAIALARWTAPTTARPLKETDSATPGCLPADHRQGRGEGHKTSQFTACGDVHVDLDLQAGELLGAQQYGRHGSMWPLSHASASDLTRLIAQTDDTPCRREVRSLRRWAQRLREAAAAAMQCSCNLQGFAASECCVVRGCLIQIHPHDIIGVRRALRHLREVDIDIDGLDARAGMKPSVGASAEASGGTSSYVRESELAGLVPELTRRIGCSCAHSVCGCERSHLCPAWGVAVVRGDCSWSRTMQGALSISSDPRSDVLSINSARSAFRTQLTRVLTDARVGVLLVEGGLGDCLLPLRVDCTAHNEVLVVTSVSLPQLEAIAAASGATIVGSVLAVEASHVGRRPLRLALRSGGWERAEDARFVLPAASQAESSSRVGNAAVNHLWIAPVSDDGRGTGRTTSDTALTLFLTAPAVALVRAVARGLDTYVNRLCDAMETGSVLPGGGATELACNIVLRRHAAMVERHASHLATRESTLAACVHHEQRGQVLRAFAEALLAVPVALISGIGTAMSHHSDVAAIFGPLAAAIQGLPGGALDFTEAVAYTVLESALRKAEKCSAGTGSRMDGTGFAEGADHEWLSQCHLERARNTGREMCFAYAPPHEELSTVDFQNVESSYAFDGVEARKQGLRRAVGAVETLLSIDHVIINRADEQIHEGMPLNMNSQ